MANRPKMAMGVTRRPETGVGLNMVNWIAVGLSLGWLVVCALLFLVSPSGGSGARDGFGFVTTLLAVVMPLALIWVATFAARANTVMREESERLQAAIDAMRQAYIAANQDKAAPPRSDLEKKVDDLVKAHKRTEALLSQLADGVQRPSLPIAAPSLKPKPVVASAPAADDTQPSLGLEAPAETLKDQISTDDFLRALNFPEDETDREGFRALRIALKDRTSAGLVRSAQDVLTLLAEDGIYMDDLTPDKAKPLVWRQFAQGTRGRAVASLGGVRDRASLALTAGRMRQDPIFRDVAHHFLRKFDQTLVEFEKTASDADIVSLSDTRTARAFMLLGRVSGTFD